MGACSHYCLQCMYVTEVLETCTRKQYVWTLCLGWVTASTEAARRAGVWGTTQREAVGESTRCLCFLLLPDDKFVLFILSKTTQQQAQVEL